MRPRLAIVASHPIQYYAPFYRALSAEGGLDVRAFFASRIGLETLRDPDMGVAFAWRTDLLAGYDHEFLPGAERITTTGFRQIDNPHAGTRLARFRPDVVLIHGYAQVTALRALAWCTRNAVPAMIISDSSVHNATGAAWHALKKLLLPFVLRRFSAFLSVGDANEAYCRAFGARPSDVFRVPTMVDEAFWRFRDRREATRNALRAEFGLGDDFCVLYVGKLIARKRPHDLLAALERLQQDDRPARRKVRVLFAGDGPLRAGLEEEASRLRLPATFAGFVNLDRLPAFYCTADALAHPAEVETFGVVVLEAAILGLPLVLSDKVGAIGPTSIARPGENALIHRSGDVEELARLLAALSSEPGTCHRLSSASLRLSEDHRGPTSVASTVAAVHRCLSIPNAATDPAPTWTRTTV